MAGTSDEVLQRLDLLIRIQRIANADAIATEQASVLPDELSELIYSSTAGWVRSGALISRVAKDAGVATRTVNRRIAEMTERGVLVSTGASTSLEYRRVELF